MSATLTENKEEVVQNEEFSFSWKDSSSIQRLLDVVSSIIAEEYIAIAKQNPEVFMINSIGDSHKERDSHQCFNNGGGK